MYPGSKFILNVRDMRSWIYSRLAHIERMKKRNPQRKIFSKDWDVTEEAIKMWIKKRNKYHLSVLAYFSERPADLLIVNFLRDEQAATRVCNYLGYMGDFHRPKENVNPCKKRPEKHVEMLDNCIKELSISKIDLEYDIYCTSLESAETQKKFPADTSMIL
jgi:hypothetical protein